MEFQKLQLQYLKDGGKLQLMESDILNEENKSKIHLVSKRLGFTIW